MKRLTFLLPNLDVFHRLVCPLCLAFASLRARAHFDGTERERARRNTLRREAQHLEADIEVSPTAQYKTSLVSGVGCFGT